nr:uncharacterized protein LOC122271040 [Parasteatoda tepidariorum]
MEPRGETVNADRYCETLQKLRRAIQNKRRGMLTAGVVLLHDNARPHMTRRTTAVLTKFGSELFDHPPYSPDLDPSDFHVFLHLKKFLSSGERFGNDEELKTSVSLSHAGSIYSRQSSTTEGYKRCFYYFNSTINPLLYSVMSNRFRVAFREKICAGNPCTCFWCCFCCCWKWLQSRSLQPSSSASSSNRIPHANAAVPTPEPLLQTRLNTNTRDKVAPDVKNLSKYMGLSYSDEANHNNGEMSRRRFSSDPNFSMRLQFNQYKDLSDGSVYHLAKEKLSPEFGNCDGECVSCTSCNSVFSTKHKVMRYTPLPVWNESTFVGQSKKIYFQEESRV